MAADRYNLVFANELVAGADPASVRRKLAATFRLDATRLDNLFSGQPVVVKRDVDLLTATRFQQAFLNAGAHAQIASTAGEPEALADADSDMGDDALAPGTEMPLALAPPGAPLDEIDHRGPPQYPDVSGLSLLPASGWDLSDCAPPMPPPPAYDFRDLSLVPLDARGAEEAQ
jgi:hypothetical protein